MPHNSPPEYDWIFLAADEWGCDVMKRVADEHFAAHPELEFVEIHEHAGWFLGWHRSGVCVSTANDCAVLPPEAKELCARFPQRKLRNVIRREVTAVPFQLAA